MAKGLRERQMDRFFHDAILTGTRIEIHRIDDVDELYDRDADRTVKNFLVRTDKTTVLSVFVKGAVIPEARIYIYPDLTVRVEW
jgi:hypothetical protein